MSRAWGHSPHGAPAAVDRRRVRRSALSPRRGVSLGVRWRAGSTPRSAATSAGRSGRSSCFWSGSRRRPPRCASRSVQFARTRRSRALLLDLMREVVAVGRAHGVPLPEDYAEQRLEFADGCRAGHDVLDASRPRARQTTRGSLAVRRCRSSSASRSASKRRSTVPSRTSSPSTRADKTDH